MRANKLVRLGLQDNYFFEDENGSWISGACKVFLCLRKEKFSSDKTHLAYLKRKKQLEDLKMAKEFIKWEKSKGVRFSYDADKGKISCEKVKQNAV